MSARARSHLVETLLVLLDEKPTSPLDAFESVSATTKDAPPAKRPVDPVTLQRAKEIMDLIKPPVPVGEDGEPEEVPKNGDLADIRDLVRDADLLEKAGVGLGKAETYRVVLALKALGDDAEFGVQSVRFFGKIFGTKADYLVAEVVPTSPNEPVELTEEDVKNGVVPQDAPGVGCNKFQYYVTNQAGATWTKLPDVTSAQLMAARQIKKLLTGDLDAPIEGYPVFPGNEANYLRAQIAQIAAATGIVPKGIYSGPWDEEDYEAPEDGYAEADPELTDLTEDPEKFKRPTSLVPLTDAHGWQRESRPLLKGQGRTSWYVQPDPEPPEDAPEDWAPPAKPQPEKAPQGLASLASDSPIAADVPAWSFRRVCTGLDNSEAAVAKSLVWPGAVTVCDLNAIKGYYWASVYVGNGSSYDSASFSPPLPPPVAEEAADPEEALDPTVEEEEAANAPAEEGGEE